MKKKSKIINGKKEPENHQNMFVDTGQTIVSCNDQKREL